MHCKTTRCIFILVVVLSLTCALGVFPVAAQGGTYVVRPGDTLTGIAARYGVSVNQLASVNGLRWNAWVYVGQQLAIPGSTGAAPAPAVSTSSGTYTVSWGDTLTGIAARYGVSVSQLASANGLLVTSWVYAGQRLAIPGQSATVPQTTATVPSVSTGNVYVVQYGDTLIGIARRYGISTSQLAARNGLYWNSWVYVGQKLVVSGQPSSPAAPTTPSIGTNPSAPIAGSDKWIDVNISTQTLTAYEGQVAVYSARVSTGIASYPTVVGTYQIYVKYTSAPMSGPGYYLPGVPYVMYFYRGYAVHGTYWHSNFGTPMSHGCVNLPTTDAQWLFSWAPIGARVVTHY